MAGDHTRRFLPLIGVGAAILALHFDDWLRLIPRWCSDPNYSHGFFVPPFALLFLWERRAEILSATARPSWLGLPLLLFGTAVKLATAFYNSLFLSSASMIFTILGAVLLLGGRDLFRIVAVPVLFLLLMLPLPLPLYERVALPLQRLAAVASTTILQGLGIPSLCEGNVIELPQRTLQVEEACSGIRSLTGFIALGVAFAYLARRPMWERVALVLSTIPISILMNVLRVLVTALLAYWNLDPLAKGTPHAATSLVFFGIAALILWGEYYVFSHLFVNEPTSRTYQEDTP